MTQIQITVRQKVPSPVRNTSFTPGTIPYMHREDKNVFGKIRSCAPCPAVMILKEDAHNPITKQWQYYMIAINPSMTLENIYLLLDDHLAFCNNTGFSSLDNPERNDYFFNRTGFEKNPQFDKVRVCSRNSVTGVEIYKPIQAIRNALGVVKQSVQGVMQSDRRQTFLTALTTNNTLNVKTFDIRNPPPLKPGRSYPITIANIDPDDYLYLPRYNREMFMVANIVNRAGDVVQFPRGGLYSWTEDNTPYSFLPICSNPVYGPVHVPLSRFIKLPKDAVVPPVYRRST
jgi:hypothetical protein